MTNIYFKPCVRPPGRVYKLVAQGLRNHAQVNLVDSPAESDFVFYKFWAYEPHIKFDVRKVVHIDYRDPPVPFMPLECLAYFKRSWVGSVKVGKYYLKVRKTWPKNFFPISYGIMDEFIGEKGLKKDIDVGCYLRPNQINRVNILVLLFEWLSTKDINYFFGPVNEKERDVFDQDYLGMLERTKILVTCNPDQWEGDSRTWEAFANRCLVFVDELHALKFHPLIDGEHCIFYKLGDEKGLLEKLDYYLKNEREAADIAENGYRFTMKYHRSANRIDEMLTTLYEIKT